MYPFLEVNTAALARNAAAIKEYVGVPIIGVVKSDGYGASVLAAARAWISCGVNSLAVSHPEDVPKLREDGFQGDILLLSPVMDQYTLNLMLRMDVILPVTSLETARFYSQNSPKPVRVHVAVDTGMGRFGIHWTNRQILSQVYEMNNLRFEGIYSHFAASFEKRYRKTARQLKRFLNACSWLEGKGYTIGIRHIANSCAALRFPETRLDAVRIGSALVGELCAASPITLERAGILKAQVVDIKRFSPGDTTGYASVCKLKQSTNAIVIALGREAGMGYLKTPDNLRFLDMAWYLLNVLRIRKNPPCVYYQGHKLRLVGRIGGQYTLFDAGDLDVRPGAFVEARANMLFPMERRRFI